MKKLSITTLAVAFILVGCSNDNSIKPSNETTEEKMTTEKPMTEKPTTEEVTTEETMTEKPTSEAKKKDTDEVVKEKEDAANSDKIEGFSFVDTKGRVNISSQAFMDYYFSGNRRTEFANIKQGMTRDQVEAVYDKSQGVGQSAQTGVGERYGDIVVVYNQQDIVDAILLNPTEKLNVEDIRRLYGEPTLDEHQYMKEGIAAGKGGAYMPTFIYDGNNQNGYHVSVTFTGIDGYVRAIETDEGDLSPQTTQTQTKDETVQNHQNQVTEEQVRAFVLKVGKPDEVNNVGYKLHHIEDSDTEWIAHAYNLAGTGFHPQYVINKETGDYEVRSPIAQDVVRSGNLFDDLNN